VSRAVGDGMQSIQTHDSISLPSTQFRCGISAFFMFSSPNGLLWMSFTCRNSTVIGVIYTLFKMNWYSSHLDDCSAYLSDLHSDIVWVFLVPTAASLWVRTQARKRSELNIEKNFASRFGRTEWWRSEILRIHATVILIWHLVLGTCNASLPRRFRGIESYLTKAAIAQWLERCRHTSLANTSS